MSDSGERSAEGRPLVLRLSVPAQGGLRAVATHVANRIAEYLGGNVDRKSAGVTLEELAARVAPDGVEGEITFEFCEVDRELLIRACCDDRSSEARFRLPS